MEDQEEVTFDFPYEGVLQVEDDIWTMYFDKASNQKGF